MQAFSLRLFSQILLLALILLGLPLAGAVLAGQSGARYLEFPPLTHYVAHAPFSWPMFIALACAIFAATLPFVFHVVRHRHAVPHSLRTPTDTQAFPAWGYAGIAITVAAWLIAWTRFPLFDALQLFTFSPLWLGYILVVNAWTQRRTGHCMLRNRPRYFLALFPASAAFWWFFEYLNRFVQNWYYVGADTLSPAEYFWFATLPFATVLPAVMGTEELLESFPRLCAGLDRFRPLRLAHPPRWATLWLILALAGLTGIGVWPDLLFPLLWIAPLILLTATQSLRGRPTIFAPLADGNWARPCRLALAALICGVFWEMWNFHSAAKWIYAVPYVNRFHLFEMPILGFAGYLPFGLECAVIADAIAVRLNTSRPATGTRLTRHWLRTCFALLAAAALWLPLLHRLYRPNLDAYRHPSHLGSRAKALLAAQRRLWEIPAERDTAQARMRRSNAEWDFMGRTFTVLALANITLREPSTRADHLSLIDTIIADTLHLEREQGPFYFLMDYAQAGAFRGAASRSVFLDGEIALMLGARRFIQEDAQLVAPFRERIAALKRTLEQGPILCGESYPDECWMFCNTLALAALRMSDALDATDHAAFLQRWLATVKSNLVDSRTGLLISSFTLAGSPLDGPEGSSIWMAAHCLQLVDPAFAADQYQRAKNELARTTLGFGYAREWPAT